MKRRADILHPLITTAFLGTLVLSFTLSWIAFAEEPQQTLQAELIQALKTFHDACDSGNTDQFRKSVTAYMYSVSANERASMASDLDHEALQFIGGDNGRFAGDRVVAVLEKGITAGLIFQCDDARDPNSPNVPRYKYELCRFVKEGGMWKLDYCRGAQTFQTLEQIKSEWQHEINGEARTPYKLFPKADFYGRLRIEADGCEVEYTINGILQHNRFHGGEYGFVWGGLKKGDNVLSVIIHPGKKYNGNKLYIYISKRVDNQETQVLKFEPAQPWNKEYTLHFTVNDLPTTRSASTQPRQSNP